MKTNPEIAKITLRKKLREEVITLIASSTDYLTQIKQYLTELRKISQKEVKAWTKEDITNIESNFNALKDLLVFGDLEDTILALLESLKNYEENCSRQPKSRLPFLPKIPTY